jgi:HEPN domain-containing protein
MKPHEEWLFKAGNDLESAKYLLSSPIPLFDTAVYHAQQCAEKALKAYLAYNSAEIDKTHSLKVLVEKCLNINNAFTDLIDDCIYLHPYATLYRYPEGSLMPEKTAVIKAVSTAEKILTYVKIKINPYSMT